jgi:hypothetical protein
MPREHSLSSRFDYLFEPLDVEDSADGADDTGSAADEWEWRSLSSGITASVRMAFAAFVLATLGAAAVVAVLLSQPRDDTDPAVLPLDQAPLPTVVTRVPAQAGAASPPSTSEVATAPQTIDSSSHQISSPPVPAEPPRETRRNVTVSPVTRAPMSVAPETRTPFPNQQQRPGGGQNNGGGGGLLGRLL